MPRKTHNDPFDSVFKGFPQDDSEDAFNKLFKGAFVAWLIWAGVCLAVVATLIVVAVHFLSKVW